MFMTVGEYLKEINRVNKIQNMLFENIPLDDDDDKNELLNILDNYVVMLCNTKVE